MQELSVIIICESALVSGGGEAVAIATALELRARGVRVGYIAGNDKADPRLVQEGVELLLLDQQSFFEEPDRKVKLKKLTYNPKIDKPVIEFMRKFDPDNTVVHAHTFRLKLSGRVPALFADEGFVLFTHGHDYSPICPTSLYFNHRTGRNCNLKPLSLACLTCECQGIPWRYKVPKLTSMYWNQKRGHLNQRTTGFLHPSQLAQEVMRSFLPNSAQHHQFRPIGKDAPAQRVQAESNRELVYIGRVTYEKGPELLLQAAQNLSIPVAIVGDGPRLIDLKAQFPNARYTGWVPNDQMADELAKARALVVPSLWRETLCLSVIDALQAGVPCIVSSTVGAKQYVQHGINGYTFESGDLSALEGALEELTDDAHVRELSERAFATFEGNRPTIQAAVDQLLEIYKEALA